jgi:lycopene cyclase domain-containing protein
LNYFSFLTFFIFIPILILLGLNVIQFFRNKDRSPILISYKKRIAILLCLTIIAVLWTTPIDNWWVANGIWYYNPQLVCGVVIGWVPIEEYTFFVLQTLMVGLFVLWGNSYYKYSEIVKSPQKNIRVISVISAFVIWIISILIFLSGFVKGTYFSLIIIWSFPPVILQLAFGADILWQRKKMLILSILIPTLYLSLADAFAINIGIWTVELNTSLGILIGNILPVEEMLFFLMTNILIVFAIMLGIERESYTRIKAILS